MTNSNFIHPLFSLETIDTAEGKKKVMNSWAFASMIWSGVLSKKLPALCIAQELFSSSEENRLDQLIIRSQKGDATATREAIAFMAFAIDEKLTEAFD
ncbi:MAG: hypothetical protein [Phormidium phage MIS-PhV1A]|uniref:hypothetical protein n=1 Tax=Phormidium phage MIS-PhV1A TaxID=1391455 RepID=UPI0003C95599|nr:MAG: hypothetical protein AV945_gp02 [Phormidium phage MIS-PhV1A]AGZ61747.1 MAG: hypothetical protein [Phormidium phage MIS-PhV1A]